MLQGSDVFIKDLLKSNHFSGPHHNKSTVMSKTEDRPSENVPRECATRPFKIPSRPPALLLSRLRRLRPATAHRPTAIRPPPPARPTALRSPPAPPPSTSIGRSFGTDNTTPSYETARAGRTTIAPPQDSGTAERPPRRIVQQHTGYRLVVQSRVHKF